MNENEPAGEQSTSEGPSPDPSRDAPSPPPPPSPPAPEKRRLQRSRDDRVIAGVCGGLGEYLGVDAVLIRIAALVLLFAGGSGLILYVIGWIAMPEAPEGAATGVATVTTAPGERTTGAVVLGLLFVLAGVFFLLDQAIPDFLAWKWIWPVALIAVGVVVLLRARR
jgi:phage shock protein C